MATELIGPVTVLVPLPLHPAVSAVRLRLIVWSVSVNDSFRPPELGVTVTVSALAVLLAV